MTEKKQISGGTAVVLIFASVLIYAMSSGIRGNFGNLIVPLSVYTGVGYSSLSFVFGISQLMYGASQPLWGVLALKRGNTLVLLFGILLMSVGLLTTPFTDNLALQTLTLGVMLGAGSGALSFGLIMGAISPIIGKKRASAASGILNAGSGIGLSALSPVIEAISARSGISTVMLVLAVPFLALIPIVFWIGRLGKNQAAEMASSDKQTSDDPVKLFKNAVRDPGYQALMIGFSTCGFHMIILNTHMVSQFVSYGISEAQSAGIYTLYGFAAMAGAVLSGFLCSKVHLKTILGFLYGSRAVAVALFIFAAPKTIITMTLFALIMGLTGDATVSPTSELVSKRFGISSMSFLFGMTFVCHQIGGFLSSWLGGLLISNGSVLLLWTADILVCFVASLASFRIKVRPGE